MDDVSTGEWLRGIAFVLVATMTVIGLLVWFVMTFLAPCGCLPVGT